MRRMDVWSRDDGANHLELLYILRFVVSHMYIPFLQVWGPKTREERWMRWDLWGWGTLIDQTRGVTVFMLRTPRFHGADEGMCGWIRIWGERGQTTETRRKVSPEERLQAPWVHGLIFPPALRWQGSHCWGQISTTEPSIISLFCPSTSQIGALR